MAATDRGVRCWPPVWPAWACRCCCSTTADTAATPALRRRRAWPPMRGRRRHGWPRSPRSTPTASSTSASPSAPRWPSAWRWSDRRPHSCCAPRSRRWPKSASVHYPWLPVGWLLIDRYPSIDRIGSLAVPVMVIAGDRDDIVPESLSRKLYDAAPDPKRYLLVPGTGHNDPELDRRSPHARRGREVPVGGGSAVAILNG